MTGISEILVLILLICVLLIIPRMMKPAPKGGASKKKTRGLGAKMRAGIVVSVLVPVISGLIHKPWTGEVTPFIITGVLPVALAWGGFWILSARKS